MRLCSIFIISIALSAQILLLLRQDPKNTSSGSSSEVPVISGLMTQDAVVLSVLMALYAVPLSCPHDRPLTTGKGRCGYFLTVVHFRKVEIRRKVGSAGNGYPVI